MTIETVIKLWTESKYRYITVYDLPIVNCDQEIITPYITCTKVENMNSDKQYTAKDCLLDLYKNSVLMYQLTTKDTIIFKVIIRKD